MKMTTIKHRTGFCEVDTDSALRTEVVTRKVLFKNKFFLKIFSNESEKAIIEYGNFEDAVEAKNILDKEFPNKPNVIYIK